MSERKSVLNEAIGLSAIWIFFNIVIFVWTQGGGDQANEIVVYIWMVWILLSFIAGIIAGILIGRGIVNRIEDPTGFPKVLVYISMSILFGIIFVGSFFLIVYLTRLILN